MKNEQRSTVDGSTQVKEALRSCEVIVFANILLIRNEALQKHGCGR